VKDWLPLITVVIAQFVLVGLYFAKQRADDKRRWHEKRLETYVAFLDRVHRLQDSVRPEGESASLGLFRMTDDEVWEQLRECQREIDRMDLLSPGAVGDAATGIWAALLVVFAASDDTTAEHVEARRQGEESLDLELASFQRAVRRALGVPPMRSLPARFSPRDRHAVDAPTIESEPQDS
jgi:hypothetical protein